MVLFLSILSTSALELIPQYSDFSGFIQPGIGYLSFEINWRYIFWQPGIEAKRYTAGRITDCRH
jgi:hypothetical protein